MIQTMGLTHLGWVCAIESTCDHHPWSRAQFEELVNGKGYYCRVSLLRSRAGHGPQTPGLIAGYICCLGMQGEAEILKIATHPHYACKGVGTSLLEDTLGWAKREKRYKIFLEVRSSNQNAISFYQHRDFKVENIRKKYYQNKEDALIMCRVLR